MTTEPDWPPDDAAGTLGDARPASATARPASVATLRDVVVDAAAAGLAIYPRGGGLALDYGGIPARPGVALVTTRLDRVVDHPVADMTISVEAGMTLAAARALVGAAGQRLAIESPDPDRATLGGIFATAWTGPRRFGWGRPRDAIIGVRFVAADGELVRGGGRVVKNVAGYDLPKLLTGSLGTLGVITELTLKVDPMPAASALVAVELGSLAAVADALDRLNVAGSRPIALELVDGTTAGREGGRTWDLLVGLEGNRAAVSWQLGRLVADLGRPITAVWRDADAEAGWLDRVAAEAAAPGPIEFRASFAPAAAIRFLDHVAPERWAIRVHAGNGVVRGSARADDDIDAWAAEVGRLRGEAKRLGGSVILARCPTAWKPRLDVWGERRPDWAIAERVKAALDPGRVMNPGRFVGTI